MGREGAENMRVNSPGPWAGGGTTIPGGAPRWVMGLDAGLSPNGSCGAVWNIFVNSPEGGEAGGGVGAGAVAGKLPVWPNKGGAVVLAGSGAWNIWVNSPGDFDDSAGLNAGPWAVREGSGEWLDGASNICVKPVEGVGLGGSVRGR